VDGWQKAIAGDLPVWHPTTFTKNRDRLLAGATAARSFDAITTQARAGDTDVDKNFGLELGIVCRRLRES